MRLRLSLVRKVWVVVTDGVTVGHPCCAIHNCFTALGNNRHQYCPEHAPLYDHKCAIIGCSNLLLNVVSSAMTYGIWHLGTKEKPLGSLPLAPSSMIRVNWSCER
jgi:hypothetical protein